MAFGKILVAYDGSEHAKSALITALELVDHTLGTDVVVLSVADELGSDPALEIAARMSNVTTIGDVDEKHAELDAELAEVVAGRENEVLTMVKYGKPADAIVAVAEELDCGLIVVGSRGLGGIRSLMGSVSTSVLHHSKVPVLTIR